jgi:hypothetical protein
LFGIDWLRFAAVENTKLTNSSMKMATEKVAQAALDFLNASGNLSDDELEQEQAPSDHEESLNSGAGEYQQLLILIFSAQTSV